MFPLVARASELEQARDTLRTVAEEEGIEPMEIEVGVMIEVPSGALGANRLAPHADFLSIGTNDLTSTCSWSIGSTRPCRTSETSSNPTSSP